MAKVSLHDRTRRVSVLGAAQLGKTQVGLNLLGQVLCETPANVIVALPSLNSLRMYNRDKLDRMIRGTPALSAAVADITERSGEGSTTAVKRGARGAQVEMVTASSSRDLQSRTARVVIMEEVTEYEEDVGGRGDPVEQLEARTIQWRRRGEKIIKISTPGVKGSCRIEAAWQDGSQGQYVVPCPHCQTMQMLRFAALRWEANRPETAQYACEACGSLIRDDAKLAMLRAGEWRHAEPARLGRHASYRINILYSPFTPWADVAREAEKVDADPSKAKSFTQQWLGETWDEAHDLPRAEILLLRRDAWPPRRIPPGVLVLMGATDVQANRLVWALWGFDRQFGQWLIETDAIAGDPTRPEVWIAHDGLLRRSWRDAWDRECRPEAWGIDSGYLSQHVYAYAHRHASDHAPEVRALDGRDGWKLPALGSARPVSFDWRGKRDGKILLHPVGTWDLKSELASALKLTEAGPGPDGWPAGALRFNEAVDKAWIDELLAEAFVRSPRTGKAAWVKLRPRNEAWDLAVYTRALARHATAGLVAEDWDRLTAERSGEPDAAQADLANLWAPDLKARAAEVIKEAPLAPVPTPRRPAPPRWIEPRHDWI